MWRTRNILWIRYLKRGFGSLCFHPLVSIFGISLIILLSTGLLQVYHVISHSVTSDIQPQFVYNTLQDLMDQVRDAKRASGIATDKTIHGYPKILHHILFDDEKNWPKWVLARRTCLRYSPGFVHMYWNRSATEDFLSKNYPWFLSTYHSYKINVQRFDSLRYFILYHYGGVYLDMDIYCKHSISSIIKSFPRGSRVVMQEVEPKGYFTISILFAHQGHGFFHHLIHNLEGSNHAYLLPYMTVMFSTGPVYFSNSYYSYENLRASKGVQERDIFAIPQKFNQKLFYEMGSSSWHQWDSRFIKFIFSHLPKFVIHLFV